MVWFLTLILSLAEARGNLRKIASCEAPKDAKKVRVIKQWHLPPTTITKSFRERYPHERNQTAIYTALNEDVKKKRVQLVVGEGCEGEINSEFKTEFNGWDYQSLAKQAHTKSYARIISHVPLKLEARHRDKLLTVCGDNEKLIQEGNLRISNLRGWAGFWSRLNESPEDSEKVKLYGEAAADLLKVPKDTPLEELKTKIKGKLKEELDLFLKSLKDRNEYFVKALEGHEFKTAAIVIGGLHAQDLRERLQAAGYACEIYEPVGYQRDNERLVDEFEKILK